MSAGASNQCRSLPRLASPSPASSVACACTMPPALTHPRPRSTLSRPCVRRVLLHGPAVDGRPRCHAPRVLHRAPLHHPASRLSRSCRTHRVPGARALFTSPAPRGPLLPLLVHVHIRDIARACVGPLWVERRWRARGAAGRSGAWRASPCRACAARILASPAPRGALPHLHAHVHIAQPCVGGGAWRRARASTQGGGAVGRVARAALASPCRAHTANAMSFSTRDPVLCVESGLDLEDGMCVRTGGAGDD